MKKSMIAGTIAGIGTAMMVIAGIRTQGFDWNDVTFIVGTMFVTFGGIHLAQLVEEWLNEKTVDRVDVGADGVADPVVRPFHLPGGESRRA